MNSHPDPRWIQQQQHDHFANMPDIGEQDFADFVNDIELDISALDFPQISYAIPQPDVHLDEKIQVNGLDLSLLQDSSRNQINDALANQQRIPQDGIPPVPTGMFDFRSPMQFDHAPQQSAFALQQNNMQSHNGHNMIPPTPNSVEMHADAIRYMQQIDAQNRAILEQHYQLRKGDLANFTPLVSPAVTPHDAQRGYTLVNDYTVPPGAYFSPLTSPALEGQPQPRRQNDSASSVATASPVDLDIEMPDEKGTPATKARRPRKRPSSPRLATSSNGLRQNAIAKAQPKKKASLTTVVPPREVQQLLDQAQMAQTSPTSPSNLRLPFGSHSPGTNDSVSPEPLSDAVMGPPPKPLSAKPSPALLAQNRQIATLRSSDGRAFPATPASLMRLQSSDSASPLMSPLSQNMSNLMSNSSSMDDLILPEAAATPSSKIDPDLSGEATPRISARKTPKLGPLSTPGSAAISSNTTARSTPLASAVTSPITSSMSPATGSRPKSEPKGRTHKKRASLSSNSMVSPALRPKISPSIKPLLPEGAAIATDDAHTIFLASRSNYQNLIEGTHVPGVNYPSDLSTNLTSKRTSHKLAEQGRRNRINLALQEMLSLLPNRGGTTSGQDNSGDCDDDDEKGGKGGLGKGTGSSKAATVESAIDYIRTLQQQSKESQSRIEEKDKEVMELRKKLDEMKKRMGDVIEEDASTGASKEMIETIDEELVDTPA